MRSRALRWLIYPLLLLTLLPQKVLAQELVTEEALNAWFYSRLIWAVVIGFVAGLVISMADLCRLRFPYVGALNVNSQARRKFGLWLSALFTVGAVVLFIDAWKLFPFGMASLAFGDVFSQIWINYRTMLVLLSMIVVLVAVVGLATRLKSDCRCRYAFIPGPRAR